LVGICKKLLGFTVLKRPKGENTSWGGDDDAALNPGNPPLE
jgi:hypothetical protein